MLLSPDLELIEGLAVAYIRSLRAIVVSDLHLGYESSMARNGLFIPKTNLKSIIEVLKAALSGRDVQKLIIVGDIKNEFSKVDPGELLELREILSFVRDRGLEFVLVKGNHDNFIEKYSKDLGIKVYPAEALIGKYLFIHGDKALPQSALAQKPKVLIMGHEHPSIGVTTKIGNVEHLRCFMYGDYSNKSLKTKILVLPAIGYFETGSDINMHSKSKLLSPILKENGVEEMEAIAVGFGATLNFGKISKLRKLSHFGSGWA